MTIERDDIPSWDQRENVGHPTYKQLGKELVKGFPYDNADLEETEVMLALEGEKIFERDKEKIAQWQLCA